MHADGQEEQKAAFQQQQPTASTNKPVILPQVTLYPSSSLKTSRHDAHLPPLDHSHSIFSSFSTLIEHDQHQQQPITVHEKEEEEDIYRITASQELYYHDCFSITCLDQDLSDTFNIANEMLPQLHRYLSQDRFVQADDVYPIHDIEYEQIVNILKALIKLCTNIKENNIAKREGLPNDYHQTLLCDIGIIETVLQIIVVPFDLAKRKRVRDKLSKSSKHIGILEYPSE